MTTKTNLVILSVLAIATIGVLSMTSNDAHAISILKLDMPRLHEFSVIDNEVFGERSYASVNTQLDQAGIAKVFAKNRDAKQNQVGVEWSREVVVEEGDTFVLTQNTTIEYAHFYKQLGDVDDSYASHFVIFPTVHAVGDRVGTLNNVWCDISEKAKFTETVVVEKDIVTKLVCNDIPAGTYLFSAYIHAFTNDEHYNSSVSAEVTSVDLLVERTRQ